MARLGGLLPFLLLGCGSGDSTAGSSMYRPLERALSYCENCIRLDSLVTLGDTASQGYVVGTADVVRDGRGNFWLGQYDDMLKVFDSTGAFVRWVGRPGQGPMEFGSPRPLFSDGRGRVHVFDPGNARLSIIGPDFELLEERPLPALVRAAAPLPDDNSIVVNSEIGTGDEAILPIHVLKGMQPVHSFGQKLAPEVRHVGQLQRRLATGPAGRIYTAPPNAYRVDVWTREGRRIGGFVGSELNEVDPLSGPSYFTWENPPPNAVNAMRMDGTRSSPGS